MVERTNLSTCIKKFFLRVYNRSLVLVIVKLYFYYQLHVVFFIVWLCHRCIAYSCVNVNTIIIIIITYKHK